MDCLRGFYNSSFFIALAVLAFVSFKRLEMILDENIINLTIKDIETPMLSTHVFSSKHKPMIS